MKPLFIVTAVLEAATGLALAVSPSLVAWLLLGTWLETPAALTVGRVAGAALVALGLACWLARNDDQSQAAAGLNAGMLLYNAAVAALLIYAGLGLALYGIALWPGVVLHLTLLGGCITCFRRKRRSRGVGEP